MKIGSLCPSLFAFILLGFWFTAKAADAPWAPVGPFGGDARRIAADPANSKHLYLGTTSSWLYQSQDGGATWRRLAKLAKEENLVLDSILVDESDPKTILIGAWVFDGSVGALFISHDSGKTWQRIKDMEGQSIRALAQSRSDSKVWVAGTLTGVYRTEDRGQHWNLISPPGSMELHEVESIAIDPGDPRTIFAGTWHLAWKTTDGGANWHTIKQGVIDDSDVFSIILDPKQPTTMYASACSGIYKSQNAGELFHKIQGIPATARRTRVLMQDPISLNVVYAGTTEGLYKTSNAGDKWARLTGPDVTVNDVYVDPQNEKHVLLATDRSGVMMSDDAGVTFHDANAGFSQRQVAVLLNDVSRPYVMYAGVLNDKTYGGVFVSQNGGADWWQQSVGLGGLDVFSLAQSSDGSLFAGTSHGIFRWSGTLWQANGQIVDSEEQTTTVKVAGKRGQKPTTKKVTKTVALPASTLDARINALDFRGAVWYAATSLGVYRSTDQGNSWQGGAMRVATAKQSAGEPTAEEQRSREPKAQPEKMEAMAPPTAGPAPDPMPPQPETTAAENAAAAPAPAVSAPTAPSGSLSSYNDAYWVSGPLAKAPQAKHATAKPTPAQRSASAPVVMGANGKPGPPPTPTAPPAPASYLPAADYRMIDGTGTAVYAASRQGIVRSRDQGKTWVPLSPGKLTSVEALATTPAGEVWIGGREGVFYSGDGGDNWRQVERLPLSGISGLRYDAELKRVVVTSWQSTLIFAIEPGDKSWKWWEAGWNVRAVRSADGRLMGASRYDGVVMQPQASVALVGH